MHVPKIGNCNRKHLVADGFELILCKPFGMLHGCELIYTVSFPVATSEASALPIYWTNQIIRSTWKQNQTMTSEPRPAMRHTQYVEQHPPWWYVSTASSATLTLRHHSSGHLNNNFLQGNMGWFSINFPLLCVFILNYSRCRYAVSLWSLRYARTITPELLLQFVDDMMQTYGHSNVLFLMGNHIGNREQYGLLLFLKLFDKIDKNR